MSRREVRRREIRTRVIGSANPVARWGRQSGQTCWDSLGGFFAGLVLFFVTFALPTCAARTEKISNQIKRLEVHTAEQAEKLSGLALISGTLQTAGQIPPPRSPSEAAVAYRHLISDLEKRLETRTETRTEVRDGKDVEVTEEVTEEVEDWVEKLNEVRWAEGWQLGQIRLNPQQARLDLPWVSVYNFDDGKHRESVEVIRPGHTVLLATELSDGQVKPDAKLYRLTTKSKEQLVAELHSGEETGRWTLIVLSVIMWTVALNLLVGPAMIFINIIPIQQIGGALRGIITIVSFVIACLLTFFVYALVKYWWLIAIVMLILTAVVVHNSMQLREAQPNLGEEGTGGASVD